MPWFFIFSGEKIRINYIKNCKLGTCMAMHKKTWVTSFLFKEFLSFFIRLVHASIFQITRHILIKDKLKGHM